MFPYNVYFLIIDVDDEVMRLVNELFVNDIPELQRRGKLCPVLFISNIRLVGS